MTTDDKQVHVRAYTKDDGTKVKEHYRGLPDGVTGTREEEDFPDRKKKELEKTTRAVDQKVQVALLKLKIFNATGYKPDLEAAIKDLQDARQKEEAVMQDIVKRLGTTTDQKEYSRLYREYVRHYKLLQKSDYTIRAIAFDCKHGNYNGLQKGLEEYRAIFSKEIERYNNLNTPKRHFFENYPEVQKEAISFEMNKYEKKEGCHDANNLWKLSVNGLDASSDYIKKNGRVVKSVSNLPPRLKSVVKEKVKSQLFKDDCKGVYFHTNSTLAKEIGKSEELKQYARKNLQKLLTGGTVNEDSLYFSSVTNLNLSLGHVDIIDMHLDKNKNLKAYIIDTYDFNEDDPSWQVEWAHNVQEKGLITNYFSVTEISVPVSVWGRI